MTKQYNKNKKIRKEIDEIKKEIESNDTVHKRNKEQFKVQVQLSLIQNAGYNPGNPLYDTFLIRMEIDLKDTSIKLDSKMEVINPQFKFQIDPRWIELQMDTLKRTKKALVKAITELKTQIITAEDLINGQITRWEERRTLLISRLKDLGEDTKDLETPNYIG